jgi:MFS family permease
MKNHTMLCVLSVTSFLWSTSSCMVFSILPTFITEELHLSTVSLGWIEGVAISFAFLAKIFSGILSDYLKKRKCLILLGTVLTFIFKMFFALATNGMWIFFARSFDRFAKGIRSAPTDAFIADLAPKNQQGKSFGLRQSLCTFGAVCGSLLASHILYQTNCDYRTVFWLSLLPVFFSFLLILFFIKDIENNAIIQATSRWNWKDIQKMPTAFWQIIGVSFVLMLARFSDSFLTLKAREVGISIVFLPIFMMIYDLVHAFFSFPMGIYADKKNRKKILLIGIFFLILADIILIHAQNFSWVLIGYIFCGLHMGTTHSLLSALIAEHTLPHLRGTAFSIYYASTGIAIFIANPLAGHLSQSLNTASAPFIGGLFFAVLSFIFLYILLYKNRERPV